VGDDGEDATLRHCATAWTAALQVCALNRGEFSATLEQAVIDLLGSEQYQVTSEIYSKLVTTSMANISV